MMTVVDMLSMIDGNVLFMKLVEYFKIAENDTRFVTIRETVEEYARDLGINILDIKENIDITEELPEQCGVYIITTKRGKYIGSAVNIKRRIRGHELRSHIKTFDVYIIEEMNNATIIEDLLIYYIRPELNKFVPNVEGINVSESIKDQKRREKANAGARKYYKKHKEEKSKKTVYPTLSQYLRN